uniref:Uncharacterized protein n=1 Tax=Cacopsylla melanoneura TaxID=428564 RepID=A0A8D8ZIJ2_9HEMI
MYYRHLWSHVKLNTKVAISSITLEEPRGRGRAGLVVSLLSTGPGRCRLFLLDILRGRPAHHSTRSGGRYFARARSQVGAGRHELGPKQFGPFFFFALKGGRHERVVPERVVPKCIPRSRRRWIPGHDAPGTGTRMMQAGMMSCETAWWGTWTHPTGGRGRETTGPRS